MKIVIPEIPSIEKLRAHYAGVEDRTAMAWWFPRIEAAGLPVPRTTLLSMSEATADSIMSVFDGVKVDLASDPFFQELAEVSTLYGFPLFLRTGHTSAKHEWKDTCFVSAIEDMQDHVLNIVNFSECVGTPFESWRRWAVREILPTIPYGTCPDYGDFPVCREFRIFVTDDQIDCIHPYWPEDALVKGGWSGDFEELCQMPDESELRNLASRAGAACGGSWSVDILETERGWYVTDMAEAHKSYHWEDCQKAQRPA